MLKSKPKTIAAIMLAGALGWGVAACDGTKSVRDDVEPIETAADNTSRELEETGDELEETGYELEEAGYELEETDEEIGRQASARIDQLEEEFQRVFDGHDSLANLEDGDWHREAEGADVDRRRFSDEMTRLETEIDEDR